MWHNFNVYPIKTGNKIKGCVMKNTIRILGIIALVAIIGFSMAACDNGNGDDGGDGSGGKDVWSALTSWSQLSGTWKRTSSKTLPFKDFYKSEVGSELSSEMQQQLGNMNIKTDESNTITVNASGANATWAQTRIHTYTLSGGNIEVAGVWEALQGGFSAIMPNYDNESGSQTVVMNKPTITNTKVTKPYSVTADVDFLAKFKINQNGARMIYVPDGEKEFWVKQ